ncbi:MAG TPA: DOMON-like domain-containing protein [Burkholderiales bacterium]
MPSAALERHPATPCAALRGITVRVERGTALQLTYTLEGQIERLRIPPPRAPRFIDGLWQHTCCELFVARPGGGYREFNFSPSGEWAAYEFDGYRTGRRAIEARPDIVLRGQQLEVSVEELKAARIGLSAVIEEEDGTISYWALRHAPGKPDFHHPDAFAMELA